MNVALNLTFTWVAVPVELSPRVTVPPEVVEVTMLQVITPVAGTLAYAGVAKATAVRPLAINAADMAVIARRFTMLSPFFDVSGPHASQDTPCWRYRRREPSPMLATASPGRKTSSTMDRISSQMAIATNCRISSASMCC